jgi:hypothetical protein
MHLLHPGVQFRVLNESPSTSGSKSASINIQSDAVLVTLFASSVVGTLDLRVWAHTQDNPPSGEEALLFEFPQLSAATTNLLLRRSSISTASIRIEAIYSDACAYSVHVRAVSSGSSDTRILGASELEVSQQTVNTGAILLIPSSLVDRSGLVIKNWSNTQTVYIGETLAKAAIGIGYPLGPKDALALDVNAGVEVYAIADAAGADLRIAQAGG